MTGDDVISELGVGFSPMIDLDTIDAICCAQKDDEAVESILAFLGKPWQTITAGIWNEHPRAITFFSHRAFLYYLPSLIQHSLRSPELVQGAVDSLLFSLRPLELVRSGKKKTRKWNLDADQLQKLEDGRTDKWRRFNNAQLSIVSAWLGALSEFHFYDLSDIQRAQLTLSTMMQP